MNKENESNRNSILIVFIGISLAINMILFLYVIFRQDTTVSEKPVIQESSVITNGEITHDGTIKLRIFSRSGSDIAQITSKIGSVASSIISFCGPTESTAVATMQTSIIDDKTIKADISLTVPNPSGPLVDSVNRINRKIVITKESRVSFIEEEMIFNVTW